MIHFLHVSKTGGTAITETLRSVVPSIRFHGHETRLSDIPAGERVIFGIRDPVTRFVSGFNSRLRKGKPRSNIEWTDGEALAFSRFSTPNGLAEALSSALNADAAQHAMESIAHLRRRYANNLLSPSCIQGRAADIVMVLHQPDLDTDFEVLKRLLRLDDEVSLPADMIGSHRTPEGFSTQLSDLARANIVRWFADDIPIYHAALTVRQNILATIMERVS